MADNSILAVDFGNVYTRAVLIDLVEGAFRVVARADVRTTAGFPIDDVSVGMRRVTERLASLTGRTLLTREGRIITPENNNRAGVDCFIATASIGRPLRTVLVGLYPEMSLASLQRAAAGTYISVIDTISAADRRGASDRLNAIALADPDLIVMAGGTEMGAEAPVLEIARTVRLALRLMSRAIPPTLLYAGNSALREQIAALFQNAAVVLFAENVRPSRHREAIADARTQLAQAFDTFTEQRGAGFEQIGYQARLGVLPTAQSYDGIVRYLGETTVKKRGGVLALDIGSAASTLAASVRGVVSTAIRTDIGLGHSAGAMVDALGLDAVRAWLPFAADDDEIAAYAYNKSVRPATIPVTPRALYLEHALLRVAGRELLHVARPLWTPEQAIDDLHAPLPPFERVIGAGAGICNTGRPGMAAMLLLDILQPIGVARLQVDAAALIPALGALARINPVAVVQVLDSGGLDELGTAISLSGTARRGAAAATVRVEREDGEKQDHTVDGGALLLVPLPIGMTATVTVQARGGLNIGGRRSLRFQVAGGSAGLIIDARGRPLPVEDNLKARAGQITAWYASATGDAPFAIPEEWLTVQAPVPAPTPDETPQRPPFSGGDPTDSELDGLFGSNADVSVPDPDFTPEPEPARGRGRGAKAQPQRGRGKKEEKAAKGKAAPPTPAKPEKEDDLDDLRSLFS